MNGLKTSLKVGLEILSILAKSSKDPITVRQLADDLQQSEKYLEQLLLPLRRARLVTSLRGPHGGYRLARPAAFISLLEIMSIMQGPLTFCDCPSRQCNQCVSPRMWQALESCIESSLSRVTLADLVSQNIPNLPGQIALGPNWVQGGLGI